MLNGELHGQRPLAVGKPLLFHLLPRRGGFREQLRPLQLNGGDETVFRHLLVGVGVHRGLRGIRGNRGSGGALREQIAIQIRLEYFVVVFRRPEIQVGRQRCLLGLGIAQLEQHCVGFHGSSGQDDHTFDSSIGQRRDPADFIGNQNSGAAHLPQHRPALDRLHPQAAGFDGRRGRFQPRERNGGDHDNEPGDGSADDAFALPALGDFRGACNVHVGRKKVKNPASRRMENEGVFTPSSQRGVRVWDCRPIIERTCLPAVQPRGIFCED